MLKMEKISADGRMNWTMLVARSCGWLSLMELMLQWHRTVTFTPRSPFVMATVYGWVAAIGNGRHSHWMETQATEIQV